MIRSILRWPDPMLSRRCDPVGKIDDRIRTLAEDMLETMYDAPGRGLAAPQVGVPLRMFVMDCSWKDGSAAPKVIIDPEIVTFSDRRATGPEGCLSIPDVTADVERATDIVLRWTDLEGISHEEALTGFEAICAQHEFDHLNGIVTFDRVSPEMRALLEAEYNH